MDNTELKEGYFWVKDTKIPPLCGEFHYWRNNVVFWDRIFGSIKELGFKHIASYIEWNFHEITPPNTPLEEIEYDFTGKTNPQRNLKGFLEKVEQEDLWLNLRPGPYIYAETEFEGPPESAVQYHRLHPKFIEKTEHYLNHVLPVIRPHLSTNGGRVFLIQLDNEVSMIKKLGQAIMGGVDDQGSFAQFAKEKYGTLEKINERYGTDWEQWDDIEPLIQAQNPQEFQGMLDAARYLEWYNAKFFSILGDIYRKNGIDVPFYINSTGPPFPHNPKYLRNIVDLQAADIYYLKKHRLINMLTLNAKLLRATNPLVFNAEFRCGGGINLSAHEYLYQALLWMGYGFDGVNYFMLVERHRWPFTPIDAVGRPMTKELFEAFKNIVGTYTDVKPQEFFTHSNGKIALLWYRPHQYAEKENVLEPAFHLYWDHGTNQIFRALLWENVMFDLYYPDFNEEILQTHPILVYAGQNFMEPAVAERIMEYVQNGGHCVFYYNYPTKDVLGRPMTTFSEILESPTAAIKNGRKILINYNDHESPGMLTSKAHVLLDYPLITGSDRTYWNHRHLNTGYTQKVGQGKISVIGFELSAENIREFLRIIGHDPFLTLSNSNFLGTIQFNEERNAAMLTLINSSETTKEKTRVKVHPSFIRAFRFPANKTGFTLKFHLARGSKNPSLDLETLDWETSEFHPKAGTIIEITPLQ